MSMPGGKQIRVANGRRNKKAHLASTLVGLCASQGDNHMDKSIMAGLHQESEREWPPSLRLIKGGAEGGSKCEQSTPPGAILGVRVRVNLIPLANKAGFGK